MIGLFGVNFICSLIYGYLRYSALLPAAGFDERGKTNKGQDIEIHRVPERKQYLEQRLRYSNVGIQVYPLFVLCDQRAWKYSTPSGVSGRHCQQSTPEKYVAGTWAPDVIGPAYSNIL